MAIYPDLKELHYGNPVSVSYPPKVMVGIDKVFPLFQTFCRLPEDIKQNFAEIPSRYYGLLSYEVKRYQSGTAFLEILRLNVSNLDDLRSMAERLNISTSISFFRDCDILIKVITPFVEELAEKIETLFLLGNCQKNIMESRALWTVSFSRYFGKGPTNSQIGRDFTEIGGYALYLYESDFGLQYFDRKKEWREMPILHQGATVLPGLQTQFASKNGIQAISSRTIASRADVRSGRYSIVLSIPLANTKVFSKANRVDEIGAGRYYNQPFGQIENLFV